MSKSSHGRVGVEVVVVIVSLSSPDSRLLLAVVSGPKRRLSNIPTLYRCRAGPRRSLATVLTLGRMFSCLQSTALSTE